MPSCAAIHHGSGGGTSSQRPINREGNNKFPCPRAISRACNSTQKISVL